MLETETIKTYQGSSVGVSQCLVTLEGFIGDLDGKTIATPFEDEQFIDEGTVDAAEAVTAINALIWEIEKREAEIVRLRMLVGHSADMLEGAQSGFIPGCSADIEFGVHRDQMIKDLRSEK